jgi:hypothetical protein
MIERGRMNISVQPTWLVELSLSYSSDANTNAAEPSTLLYTSGRVT